MIFRIITAPIRKLLKLLVTPFLYIWAGFRWLLVIIIAPFILLGVLIRSIKRGDWK